MSELWITHYSVHSWSDPKIWATYLQDAQSIVGHELSHLDTRDPVRRRVRTQSDLAGAGEYITAFGKREDSRWLFGRFEGVGIDFTLRHSRSVLHYPNSMQWYVPADYLNKPSSFEKAVQLFELGSTNLSPFYGYSDFSEFVVKKKRDSGAVDIQAELPGIFWLVYFSRSYVGFFGREKISSFPGVKFYDNGGVMFRLGTSPFDCTDAARLGLEEVLGRKSFVNPQETRAKPPGRYALTFAQLLE